MRRWPRILRFVLHASQGDADEAAPGGPRDGATEGRLAHTGRPDETQDGPTLVGAELAHGDVLEDALLGALEAVVILVEHAARFSDVEPIRRRLAPRQVRKPLDVGAGDLVLGARRRHGAHAAELLACGLLSLGRHVGVGDALAQVLDLVLVVLRLAELALDRLHLLAQQELALRTRHLLLHHRRNLFLDPVHLALALHELEHAAQTPVHVEGLEDRLLGVVRDGQVRSDQVGEGASLRDVVEHRARIARRVRQHLCELARGLAQVSGQGLGLDVVDRRLVDALDAGLEVGRVVHVFDEAHARHALQDDAVVARAEADHLQDARNRADRVDVGEARILNLGSSLGHDPDGGALGAEGFLDQPDRTWTPHVHRNDGRREEDRIAQWEDRQQGLAG